MYRIEIVFEIYNNAGFWYKGKEKERRILINDSRADEGRTCWLEAMDANLKSKMLFLSMKNPANSLSTGNYNGAVAGT